MKLFRRRPLSTWGRRYLVAVLLVILVIGSFNAGLLTERYRQIWGSGAKPVSANTNVPPELQAEFENFVQVWQLVGREYYYGTPTGSAMDYAATRGLLSSLGDDYTTFLDPPQQQGVREQMSGDYEGVGVYLESKDGHWVVTSPIRGAPADTAGLQMGDALLRVDGNDVSALSIDDVQGKLRGKAGTVVHLSVQRPGRADTLELDVTRAVINIPSVRLQMLDGNIALISVTIFGDKTTAQLDDELKHAQDAGAKAIILDLRNNGGGWVQAAQEMIGRFVDPARGPALLEDKDNGAQAKTLLYTPTAVPPVGPGTPTAVIPTNTPAVLNVTNPHTDPIIAPQKGGLTFYDIPLVVLVNGGTASASEIVVGALQDYGRVTTVGTKTYGKGSIQAVHEFKDGSSARITIAQWLTPKARVIQKQGLHPDYVLENPEGGADEQLAKAVEVVKGKLANTP